MILPHPFSLPSQPNPPPKKPLLPLQQKSNMIIIQMHENPLYLLSHLSPHCVAAKSLMYEPPDCFYIV